MVDTVKIACKLPNGLTITHAGKSVTLKGANDPAAVGGFGVTRDVDKDWFADFVEGNGKDLPFIKNGSVFVIAGRDTVGATRERKDVDTGMSPLDPDAPMPGIEPTDETKKVLAGETE